MIAYNPRRWRDHFFDIRGSMVREIAYRVGGCVLFAIAAELMYLEGLPVAISDKAHLLIGPALALLLVFRTNSANDRYWEGRRLWGGVVNSARNLRRKARVLFIDEPVRAALIVEWTIAFFWGMRFRLLGRASLGPTCALPEAAQAKALLANSIPLAAADALTALIDAGRKSGLVTDIQQSLLDADVQALVDHLGGCERIDQTPLPYAYAVHLRRALFLYCCALPFALVTTFGPWTVLVTLLVSYVLIGIEEIGTEIEGPFGEHHNDLPLQAICTNLEKTLRSSAE